MPRATIDTQYTQKFNLESLDGGWIELRKLSYGERTKSREMSMKLGVRGASQPKDVTMDAEFQMADVARFEFSRSIVDHNLEDDKGNKINFSLPGAIESLDAAVGAEIERLIDEFNAPKETGTNS